MTPLFEILSRRIAAAGPLSLAEYMAEALGHPRHGYYATRDPLGAAGDFVTAPEISQMFGELLGLWCAACWDRLGRPDPVLLAELGPGRGTLMADALRAARVMPGFLGALRLHLVETSPVLRAAQAAALESVAAAGPELAAPPSWHATAAELPDGPLLLLANEFFDALPVRQFQRTPVGWRERRIGWDADIGGLRWVLAAAPDPAAALIDPTLDSAPVGAIAEVGLAGRVLAAELGRRIAAEGGAALIIDYGYAAPGTGDTFQAVRRHRFADPLAAPGEADLTAHVDFAALAAVARQAGAVPHGPLPQGEFLRRLGIAERAAMLRARAVPGRSAAIDTALDRLTDPDQMGTLFKVLALAAPTMGAPPGF